MTDFNNTHKERVASAVQGRGGRMSANGETQFLCPAHEERVPSACWNPTKGVWFCHGCGAKGNWRDLAQRLGIELPKGGGPEATYDYTDEAGKLLFQVCRYLGKQFRQRRPDGNGGWTWTLGETRRVLYRLPELLQAVQRNETVYIVEGEKDVHSLTKLDLVATTNPGGAGKWRQEYNEHLRGASVVVLPDNDGPGHKHAEQVATALRGVAVSVRVLRLPGLPKKGDASDWLAADGTKDKLLALVKECPEWELAGAKAQKQERTRAQPIIITTGRFLRDITADTLRALVAANSPPELYIMGSEVVRASTENIAEPISEAALRGRMDRVANYIKVNAQGEGSPAKPPVDVARDILALPARELPFPSLQGVRHAPLFLPCGHLLAADGYDPGSGLLMRLRGLNGVRGDKSLSEARHWVEELLYDFPFECASSKAHAAALLLQPFVRELIDGPTPLYLIDAPARGTGKGLLADVLTSVATGRDAAVMSLTGDGDEVEKRITSLLLAGGPHVQFDNVRTLRSLHLEAVLTTLTWSGRRLGKSEMVSAPNRATWLATGNNVEVSDEMARRIAPIRLDARVERPEDRTGFRHQLPGWAYENRGLLVSACLSIIQNWITAGRPQGAAVLGLYESWARIMGGLTEFIGFPGFLQNRKRLQSQADLETQEWIAFTLLWWERFNTKPVTAGELFEIIKEQDLFLDIWNGRSKMGALQRLGHALKGKRDRIFGQYVIRTAGRDGVTRNAAYRLEFVADGGGAFKPPEPPTTTPGVSGGLNLCDKKPPAGNPCGTSLRDVSGVSGGPPYSRNLEEIRYIEPGAGYKDAGLRDAAVALKTPKTPGTPGQGDGDIIQSIVQNITRESPAENKGLDGLDALDTALDIIVVDIETTGLNPREGEIRLVSLAATGDATVLDTPILLQEDLANPTRTKVFHNAAFDVSWLNTKGYPVHGYECTLLMAQVLSNYQGNHSLQALAKDKLGIMLNKEFQKPDCWQGAITDEHREYAQRDAETTYKLYHRLRKELADRNLQAVYERERAALPAIIRLQQDGMPFDADGWGEALPQHKKERDKLEAEIKAELSTGINLNSSPQLLACLRNRGLELHDTSDESLAEHETELPILATLRQWRKKSKLVNTYGEKLLKPANSGGRIYPSWRLIGTVTGRMSCKEPNLQQVPAVLKPYFKASPGHIFIVADYAQIELRVVAELSQDEQMLSALSNGGDLHTLTAKNILKKEVVSQGERQFAKAANFGLIYGMTEKGLQRQLKTAYGISATEEECATFKAGFFALYSGIKNWQNKQIKAATINTLGGRCWSDRPRPYARGWMARFNYPVQGTAAEGLKEALALLVPALQPGWKLCTVVHDEILLEVPEHQAEQAQGVLKRCMIDGMQRLLKSVPVEVECRASRVWEK